jgi:hypothetical protein
MLAAMVFRAAAASAELPLLLSASLALGRLLGCRLIATPERSERPTGETSKHETACVAVEVQGVHGDLRAVIGTGVDAASTAYRYRFFSAMAVIFRFQPPTISPTTTRPAASSMTTGHRTSADQQHEDG